MFVYPQIGWGPKSGAVGQIAESLNFGLDAVAFIDDQEFELAEVAHGHPSVLCIDAADLNEVLDAPEFNPRFITEESSRRRHMYRSQITRDDSERDFQGPSGEFLASLQIGFRIRRASRDDLRRAEELTVRTNQLNSTGRTYSFDELEALRASPDHLVLVAELDDRFGAYGTIGLALVERGAERWHLRLLLMSCGTMSRGVGTVLLNYIMAEAREAGVRGAGGFRGDPAEPDDADHLCVRWIRRGGTGRVTCGPGIGPVQHPGIGFLYPGADRLRSGSGGAPEPPGV